MEKINKTNAARLLDKAGIPYELVPYEVDENDLSAGHIAAQLGEDINRVFKTLVLRGEKPAIYFCCVIPGNAELDLKKAAKAAGCKKADLIHLKELQPLTGYIRGGTTAIGMKKPMPAFFHTTATDADEFFVSAGQRGLQLRVNPRKFIDYARGSLADLITEGGEE